MFMRIVFITLVAFILLTSVVLNFLVAQVSANPRKYVPNNFIGPLEVGTKRVPWLKIDPNGTSRIWFIPVKNPPYG